MGRSSEMKPFCSFLLFCGAYVCGLVRSAMEKLKLKSKGFFCSRGCLGCCKKPPVIISMDEPYIGLGTQGQIVYRDYRADDFWSSSTFEKDNSAAQSQRSISSFSASNNPSDPQSSVGSEIGPAEFVNQGLVLWNQVRQQWVGNKRSERQTEVQGPRISSSATYNNLLGNNERFPQPIPLREMVEFLVEIWDEEGLYD